MLSIVTRVFATVFCLSIVVPAQAVLIHVDAAATWDDTTTPFDLIDTLLPPPTTLHASIDLDIGPGEIDTAPMDVVSGELNWEHPTLGTQVVTFTGLATISTKSFDGSVGMNFYPPFAGSTIAGVSVDGFGMTFNIGTNPFSLPPGAQLAALIANSSVEQLHLNAEHVTGRSMGTSIDSDVAYSISVPEPTNLALLGLGLAGIGFSRRKLRSIQ